MKHLVRAVFTLTFFSLIDRILGFVFKIYLSRELGAVNLGIYQIALSSFFVLLTLTTSGIPLIVSKLTAKYRVKKDLFSEQATVSSALIIGVTFSVLVCGVIFVCAEFIGGLFATRQSMTVLIFLLPGVIFSGVYGAFRGNLWGRQRYATVSIIEISEQIFRIALCVILIYLGLDKLKMSALSLSASCALTAILCIICYFAQKGRLKSPKGYILPLIKSSTPITLIRASGSLVNSLIAIAVPFLLRLSGKSISESLAIFGSSVGMAMPLLYLPITVVGSLAYVMIPTLSSAVAQNNKKSLCSQIEKSIAFSIVIASMFVPMYFALGKPIGSLIYDNADSGGFLSVSAWLLIPLSVESITSSMMNSLDLEKHSFRNYLIGAGILFAFLFAFTGHFRIELLSIGLGIAWSLSSILDIISIRRKVGISLGFIWTLIKCVTLIFPSALLTSLLNGIFSFLPSLAALTLSAFCGIAFFALLSLVFGIIDISAFKISQKKKGILLAN